MFSAVKTSSGVPSAITLPLSNSTRKSQCRAAMLRSCTAAIAVAPLPAHCRDEAKHAQLMQDVQVGRRLIEQEDARLLSKRAGDEDALALAAGQRFQRSIRELLHVRQPHGLQSDALIRRSLDLESPHVGIPAHEHKLKAREAVCHRGDLRHKRDGSRPFTGRHLCE